MATRREVLAALGVAGSVPGADVAVGQAQPQGSLTTDFAFETAALPEQGWVTSAGQFRTDDSDLVSAGGRGDNYDVRHEQPSAVGTFRMNGVRNTATYYGLKSLFVSDSERRTGARGYMVRWDQTRKGKVRLYRLDGDAGSEQLLVLADDHRGERTDVVVERSRIGEDEYRFDTTVEFPNGERVERSVTEPPGQTKYIGSRYWVQRHDAGADLQRVDGLAVGGETTSDTPDGQPENAGQTAGPATRTADSEAGLGGSPADVLDGWLALLAWTTGVPALGSLVLGALVALEERYRDDADGN
jgi:hypothetical protein